MKSYPYVDRVRSDKIIHYYAQKGESRKINTRSALQSFGGKNIPEHRIYASRLEEGLNLVMLENEFLLNEDNIMPE